MTHSSHRADEPVNMPTNGDTCVCKFRDAIVCILSDGQQEWAAVVHEVGGVLDEPRRSQEEGLRHPDGGEVAVVVSGQDAEGGDQCHRRCRLVGILVGAGEGGRLDEGGDRRTEGGQGHGDGAGQCQQVGAGCLIFDAQGQFAGEGAEGVVVEVPAGGAFGDVHVFGYGGDSVGEQVLESVGGDGQTDVCQLRTEGGRRRTHPPPHLVCLPVRPWWRRQATGNVRPRTRTHPAVRSSPK